MNIKQCLRIWFANFVLFIADPAIKVHVRRILSPGELIRECSEPSNRSCRQQGGAENNSTNRHTANYEDKKSINRKPGIPELPSSTSHGAIDASQYAARSNGSYSDASGSSEFESLLPQIDSFKEEERAQWEPLFGDKFSRQKNPPRYE